MTNTEEKSFNFIGGVNTLIAHAEAEKKVHSEFKGLVRAAEWKHASLMARGIQTHMEFMLLGTGVNSSPTFVAVPRKLQRLLLEARLAHFEHGGKNWYHYNLRAELAVTQGGYRISKFLNSDKEPLPFGERIPWDKIMLEDAEFDVPFERLPDWFQKLLKSGS